MENEESVCSVCRSILERHRFLVVCAANGEQGLAFYRDNAPEIDLVLCDHSLPTMGGPKLIRRVRSLDESARIVLMMMSSYDIEEVVPEDLAKTCILLNKPFTCDGNGPDRNGFCEITVAICRPTPMWLTTASSPIRRGAWWR